MLFCDTRQPIDVGVAYKILMSLLARTSNETMDAGENLFNICKNKSKYLNNSICATGKRKSSYRMKKKHFNQELGKRVGN